MEMIWRYQVRISIASEDISMENLKLKDIDQSKEHTRGNQLNLLRGQNNKMMGGQVDQVKDDWN